MNLVGHAVEYLAFEVADGLEVGDSVIEFGVDHREELIFHALDALGYIELFEIKQGQVSYTLTDMGDEVVRKVLGTHIYQGEMK